MGVQKTTTGMIYVDGNPVTIQLPVVEPDEEGNYYGVVNPVGYNISIGASLPFSKEFASKLVKEASLAKAQALLEAEMKKLADLEAQFDYHKNDPDLAAKYLAQYKSKFEAERIAAHKSEVEQHFVFANEVVVLDETFDREI